MLHRFVGGRHLHLGLRGQVQTAAAMDLWARLGLQPGSDLLSALCSDRVLPVVAAKPASVLDWLQNAMPRCVACTAPERPRLEFDLLITGCPLPLQQPWSVAQPLQQQAIAQNVAESARLGCNVPHLSHQRFPLPFKHPCRGARPLRALSVGQGSAWGSSSTPAQPQAELLRAQLHVKGRRGKAFTAGC